MCKLFNYQTYITSMLTQLEELDGIPISQESRSSSESLYAKKVRHAIAITEVQGYVLYHEDEDPQSERQLFHLGGIGVQAEQLQPAAGAVQNLDSQSEIYISSDG